MTADTSVEVERNIRALDDTESSVSGLEAATSVLPINGMGRDHRCDPRASESAYPASALSLLSDENLGPTGDTAHPGFVGCRANGGTAINDNGGSRCLDPPTHPNNLNLLGPPVAIDSHEQTWQRWINRATPQDKLLSVVETLFSSREAIDVVDSLRGSDAQAFIDVMDEALDSLNLTSRVRKKCVKALYKMCVRHSLLPSSAQIEPSYDPAGVPHSRGGSADIWKGEHCGLEVAVKVLRTHTNSDLRRIMRRFCKEFVTWRALRHPNVLPLVGVMMTGDRFALVSEWMTNGNIAQFVREHWDADRFELLSDVARGLVYIHGQGMIHGDLKGANILVDQTRHARLADFGLLTIIPDSTASNSDRSGGTIRWMAPELFDPEIRDHRRTKASDCYALGMVIYEVLSGRVPFYQHADLPIIGMVSRGDRPERPQGTEGVWFTDDLWGTLGGSWAPQPANRPNIEDVLQCLETVSRSWLRPSPGFLEIQQAVGSPTWGSSDVIIGESTDWSGISPPSRSSEQRGCNNHMTSRPDAPKVCGATGCLPTSTVFSTGLKKCGNIAVASGGFTDLWRGEWDGTQVAIKAFRVSPGRNFEDARKILWERAPMWKKLSHESVLPFRGVNTALFRLALVSDWGQNGNINQHIASRPNVSRPSLLFDVAKGLKYLHSLDILHGDLKGANVIIDQKGRARLAEYGFAPLRFGPGFMAAGIPRAVGVARRLAPELLKPPRDGNDTPVTESGPADVFAFAMLAVEVFTGNVPFEEQKNEAVILRISLGGRPEMPGDAQTMGLTAEMWELLGSCWQQDPEERPTMEEVVKRWEKFVEYNDDDSDVFTREPQPTNGSKLGIGLPRARSEATRSRTTPEVTQPRMTPEVTRSRTTPEATRMKTEAIQPQAAVQPRSRPETPRLQTGSGTPELRLGVDPIRLRMASERTKHETIQPQAVPTTPQKNAEAPKRRRRWLCGLF